MYHRHHHHHVHCWPAPNMRFAVTLNDLVRQDFTQPGDQLPASEGPLFSHMALPRDKEKPFSRKFFIDELVRVCGEFEVRPHDYIAFQRQLDNWSRTRLRYWQRMYDVLNKDYEPLHNYDRTEAETTDDNSDARSKVAGYDSGALVDESSADGKAHKDRNLRAYGNIGVTTSQEMLLAELDVADQSMVKIIINEFKDEFCLLVY